MEPVAHRTARPPLMRLAFASGRLLGRTAALFAWPYRRLRRLTGGGELISAQLSRPPGRYPAADLAAEAGLLELGRALSDPDPIARSRALDVICEFSEERASRLIAAMLYDPDAQVRRAAAEAASRLNSQAVVFPLILALEDRDGSVRREALRAIEDITSEVIELNVDAPADERRATVEGLKRRWKQRRTEELLRELSPVEI
ncbi:MAG: HEAT repeat domain-containing protein [Myxococcales bacterium]|nr:HEAT repeat domain-containing protein [Myxococcales bacterium]